ncbi:MAG: hypothetical protein DWQ36_01580 [Acidobacteria bacterium]|nr:MAG: hypothetical protein DWQ36_01580 [Acidobacteriota bacterium]
MAARKTRWYHTGIRLQALACTPIPVSSSSAPVISATRREAQIDAVTRPAISEQTKLRPSTPARAPPSVMASPACAAAASSEKKRALPPSQSAVQTA